jgi:hypothetical protein
MPRLTASLILLLTLSGCVGPLDPMCYPQTCLVWLVTHGDESGTTAPGNPWESVGRK